MPPYRSPWGKIAGSLCFLRTLRTRVVSPSPPISSPMDRLEQALESLRISALTDLDIVPLDRISTMLTRKDQSDGAPWIGPAILVVGVGVGVLLRDTWTRPVDAASVLEKPPLVLSKNLEPAPEPEEVADNGLETLSLTIDRESAEVLQNVRNRAMHRGIIVQTDEDTVPAVVSHGGTDAVAEIRIKGDWTDHIRTEKWSFRIKLENERLFGMRVFSIQRPKTRGFLWEWFVLAAFRREGVLAPRSTFVNVVINDNYAGVYYLEEHPAKELLEAQGRREGPIVLWDEQTHWASLLQAHNIYSKGVQLPVPTSSWASLTIQAPFVRAFGERRLSQSDALTRSYYGAVEKMQDVQSLTIAAYGVMNRMKRLQAVHDLQGTTIDSLVDIDRVACAHALASLFQIKHSLFWHNMRFYHDPVLDRLEPVMFDNMAQDPALKDPVMFRRNGSMPPFEANTAYYNGVFRYLGRFCEPEYLDQFYEETREDIERFEAAVEADDQIPKPHVLAAMRRRVRVQQDYLRDSIRPANPISFTAEYVLDDAEGVTGVMEVTAWGTTRIPVVVEGFRFGDDSPEHSVPTRPRVGESSCRRTGRA